MLASRASRLITTGLGWCGCRRGLGYFWGHTTKEEIEAEEKRRRDGPIMAWQNPESDLIQTDKTASYVPMRVEAEERALASTTWDLKRFNMADYYGFMNHPHAIYGYLKHPEHYFTNQKIKAYSQLVANQKFNGDRLLALGPDLAASSFLLSRNCRVKFKERSGTEEEAEKVEGKWTSLQTMRRAGVGLPVTWQPGLYVEAIDASCSDLVYEGFNSLRNLIFLKSLDVSYCPEIDDWCLDRISGEFQDSLESLDISGCSKVNLNGLECLWRLRKLKVLKLRDMDHIQDIKLVCLMLLEENPDLRIEGVDYEDTKILEDTEHQHLIAEYESMLLNPGNVIPSELPSTEPRLNPAPPFHEGEAIGSRKNSVKNDTSSDLKVKN